MGRAGASSLRVGRGCRGGGIAPAAAATAVALSGVVAPLVALHFTLDPAGVASFWLVIAGCLAGQSRRATAVAGAAAVVAVLATPLVGVGLLVFAAVGLRTGHLGEDLPVRGRQVLQVFAWSGALAVGVLATGSRRWTVTGAGPPPPAVLVGLLAVGTVVVAGAWLRLRNLRPVAVGVGTLLVTVAVPGAHAVTALLLAVPVLAVLAAALLDVASTSRPLVARLGLAAVLVLGTATSGSLVTAAAAATPPRDALGAWIRHQLDPAVPVQADALTRAELRHEGVDPNRLVPLEVSAPPGAVVVGAPVAAGARRAELPDGPAGGAGSVQLAREVPVPADAPDGAHLGRLVSRNPALALDPAAVVLLERGAVDRRLVMVLTGLTATHRLIVSAFPAVPGEPDTALRRTVLVTAVDGVPVGVPGVTEAVDRWLAGQQSPFRPATVAVVDDVLVIQYVTPSPLDATG